MVPRGRPVGGWWQIVHELAAVCQVDPNRRGQTLREIVWMSNQRGKHEWQQTALLASILINANRDPKKRPISPDEINPYVKSKQSSGGLRICKQNQAVLKKLFTERAKHAIGIE